MVALLQEVLLLCSVSKVWQLPRTAPLFDKYSCRLHIQECAMRSDLRGGICVHNTSINYQGHTGKNMTRLLLLQMSDSEMQGFDDTLKSVG